MPRTLNYPGKWTTPPAPIPLELGGTGKKTADEARQALGALAASSIGLPLGPIPLREDLTVDPKYLGDLNLGIVAIDGPLSMLPGETKAFYLTTYDSFTDYTLQAVSGTVTRDRNVVRYTAGTLPGVSGFVINGRQFQVLIQGQAIAAPTITFPKDTSVNVQQPFAMTASPFIAAGGNDTHASSDWQFATDINFVNSIKWNTGSTASKTKYTVTDLPGNTKVYARVRYTGTAFGKSPWSVPVCFTTAGSWRLRSRLFSTSPTPSAFYGQSVAISRDGKTAIVGAPGISNGQGAAYVYTLTNSTWSLVATLRSFAPTDGDHFGSAVTLNGDGTLAVVGAENDSDDAAQAGAAYVFFKMADTWTFYRKLRAEDAVAGNNFGHSLALNADGSLLLVGAPNADQKGALYAFTRVNYAWTQQQKITVPDGAVGDGLGVSVALNADATVALVGARLDNAPLASQGAVYLLRQTNQQWTSVQRFQPTDAAAGDAFGASVALSSVGDVAFVGAPNVIDQGVQVGATYLFTVDQTTMVQKVKLLAKPSHPGDAFGAGVALSGDATVALFGAPLNDDYVTDGGTVYCYDDLKSFMAEVEVAEITGLDVAAGDAFGSAVTISSDGSLAAVSVLPAGKAGCIYLFARSGSSWIQQQKILPDASVATDARFGASVAFNAAGTTLLIGAPGSNGNTGAVYAYVNNSGVWTSVQRFMAADGVVGDTFGSAIAMDAPGQQCLIGAPGGTGGGAVYQFSLGSNGLWAQQARIVPDPSTATVGFGRSLAVTATFTNAAIGAAEADNKGAVYYYGITSGAFKLWTRLQASDAALGDLFGSSLALNATGSLLYVGSPHNSDRAADGGAVYIYRYGSPHWELLRKLFSGNIAAGDHFGSSVALTAQGTVALVGAPQATFGGVAGGSLYGFN